MRDYQDHRSRLFVSEALCVEKMFFTGTSKAVLEGKLDSAFASTHLANINIATHTPEVTHDKTLTGCHPMVGLSQFKRDKLIIPLT